MRLNNTIYGYFAVFVHDLLIAKQDLSSITKSLGNHHQFNLKCIRHLQYHLVTDKDNTGTLCLGLMHCIKTKIKQYKFMFEQKPNEYTSPLEKIDHSETDLFEEKDQAGIKVYQSMIGSLKWDISLGRFDIQKETMTMSRFCIAPNKGNLERLNRYMDV
jgi:hypothetical protein